VERECYDSLQCGVLAHGFLQLGCDTCHQALWLAFRCQRRGFCPACAGRRMAQTAAQLVAQVIPWVPTRPGSSHHRTHAPRGAMSAEDCFTPCWVTRRGGCWGAQRG
jgi:hypothetical protein